MVSLVNVGTLYHALSNHPGKEVVDKLCLELRGGGQDWVHPFFSNNLPTAYLNPRAVTRHLADKVSKGHTRGLAWPEKTLSQALPFSFERKFDTPSGASVGIVPP